jgi:pimeloyl-ACP methyl ester carboxylesterase
MTSYVTAADGIDIAYDVVETKSKGEGEADSQAPPVVLIHGFGANRAITWRNTNWYQTLPRAGHRIIAIDCRGHGESQKPHRPEDYDEERMTADIVAVLVELGIGSVDLFGYSMGAQLAMRLMSDAPGRIRRAVLGGLGANYFRFRKESTEKIAEALLAKDPSTIMDPIARDFRTFCERAGDDLVAMAACIRRPRHVFSADELREITQPVLVVCGSDDNFTGSPGPLAEAFANGKAVVLPSRNHHSTVGDKLFREAVIEFLGGGKGTD